MMKRFVAVVLVMIMVCSGGFFDTAQAYAASHPIKAEQAQDAPRQDALPTGLASMSWTNEDLLNPEQAVAWEDEGGSWQGSGDLGHVELSKTYEKNDTLVTLRKDDTSISFAPIMIEASAAAQTEVAESQRINERQTASNVLRIGSGRGRRPDRIAGKLRGGAARRGEDATQSEGIPAVYEALFDANTNVEMTALNGGIKEDIVIGAYTGNHVYAYEMTLSGLNPSLESGEVILRDAEGNTQATVAAPFMVDANGERSEDIAVALDALDSGAWKLTYAPNDVWLADSERAYPVTVDPSVWWAWSADGFIQDAYVFSNNKKKNFGYTGQMRVGLSSKQTYTSYLQTVIPERLRSGVLIKSVHLNLHGTPASPGTFTLSTVYGKWGAGTITWNNQPSSGGPSTSATFKKGQVHEYVDVTEIFCNWLNTLDQGGNNGICISGVPDGGKGYHTFHGVGSSQAESFEVQYWPELPKVNNLQAVGYGYGSDSEEGWVDLTWDAIPEVDAYYVGIYTGKKDDQGNALYEYIYVGNTTSFTTKGKGLWPTPAEVEAGKFDLHPKGGGAELHAWPFQVYQNAKNDAYAGDLNYYFRVVPSNKYKQLPADAGATTANIILPIDMPPTRPSKVAATPASWTNADTVKIDWEGTMVFDVDLNTLTQELGEGGQMQYTVDPEDIQNEAGMTWIDTGSTSGTDSIELSTMRDPLAGPITIPAPEEPVEEPEEPEETTDPETPEETEEPEAPAPWADGTHLVLIRGISKIGKIGKARAVPVYIDKTPPTAPDFSATPKSWSNADTASFTWSGISDMTDLARVEWSGVDGEWITTRRTDKTYVGHEQDTTMLADGRYTISLRGVDLAGNLGDIAQDDIWIDRNGPSAESGFLPGAYSDAAKIQFYWKDLKDDESGTATMGYAWGDEERTPLDIAQLSGQVPFDVSTWADGPYYLTFERTDNIGNVATDVLQFYRDTVPPLVKLLSPIDGDVIGGMTEIWAQVEDDTLASWTLSAIRADGSRVELGQGTDPCLSAELMLLNTLQFDDNEKVRLVLTAVDKAGHRTTDEISVISAKVKPLPAEVNIVAPKKGEVVTAPKITGNYEPTYSGTEARGTLYMDGEIAPLNGRNFPIEAILLPEGSSHTVAVISEDADGRIHYSAGLGARMLISEALDFSGPGELESVEITNNQPMYGLRLHAREQLGGGSIAYSYSTDGGATWLPIAPEKDVRFDAPQATVRVKAQPTGGAMLQTWDIEGVVPFNPVRYSVRLTRPVGSFKLEGGTLRKALSPLGNDLPEAAKDRRLFEDGFLHEYDLVYDALSMEDGDKLTLSGIAGDEGGGLNGSGNGRAIMLLRESPAAIGTLTSEALTTAQKMYAVRLLTLTQGGTGTYEYSLDDGQSWKALREDEYTWLGSSAHSLKIRARMPGGATLRAWHLEGVTADSVAARVQLIQTPINLTAMDYSEYYENPELRMHQLAWTDPTPADGTHPNKTVYEIERNGELLATVETTRYVDQDFVPNAKYRVRAIRTYEKLDNGRAHDLTRTSGWAEANNVLGVASERILGVQPSCGEMNESEYLDWLYGGTYTLSTDPHPPTGGRALDQKLLGSQKLCALGFEPINFNTGNFFLMMQDVHVPDVGGTALDVIRTYNTQSDELNGPFGARWNTDYAEHLVLYMDGSVGWRRSDGGLNVFERQADGSYVGNDDDALTLRIDEAQNEYEIIENDGTIHAFTGAGLLKRIERANGRSVRIERDSHGLITSVTAPSGAKMAVEMDEAGHITQITTPGGESTTYAYEGNNLVLVTNPAGGKTRYLYDDKGRMTEWYDASGTRQVYNEYDEKNRVVYQEDALKGKYTLEYFDDHTVTTDALGGVRTVYFDDQKRSIREVDALGNAVEYSYTSGGQIATETDERGRKTCYSYDERGNLLTSTQPDGSKVTRTYDEADNLTSLTDQLGNTTTYTYDEKKNLLTETAPDGGVVTYAYDAFGQLLAAKDALGNTTTFAYDDRGQLQTQTDALGNATSYAYDAGGRVSATTDALGNITKYSYDAQGNLTALSFADETQITYTYDAMKHQTSMTDPLGNVTTYKYDALGNLIETILPDGSMQTATYDKNYRLTSVRNALKEEASYTYDANGNKLTETDALGNITIWTYDAAGFPTAMTLPTGAQETYVYDKATGLLVESTDVTGLTNRFAYDAAGNLLERTLPGGGALKNEYDSMNRLIKQINPAGGETTITYDANGNISSVKDPLGAITKLDYDALGRLVKTTDALGNATTTEYDALGRIASTTDALGAKTSYEYDVTGNLISTTDALGNVQTFAYDADGSMTSITDPLGNAATLAYNQLGQAIALTQKNGGVVATKYDVLGRVIQETDPLGSKTKYMYDKLGRVTQVTDALEQKALFEYDALGNITKITAPGGGQTLYAYDAGGRLLSNTDEAGLTTAYSYNERGQIAKTEANGNATTLAYDAAGNIASVTDAEGRTVAFAYDLNGNQTKVIYPDGSCDITEYDLLGRIAKVIPRSGMPTEYAYDARGKVTEVKQGERCTRYAYDLLGRLTKQIMPDGSEQSYAYDPLGNLIGQKDPLGNETKYAYNPEALLEKITYANGAEQSLSYDLAGQVIAEIDAEGAKTQYAYDKVGRLTQVTDALGKKTAYKYNSLDQIAQVKDALGQLTKYEHDARGNLIAEIDALGNKVQYAYTPEGWLASITKADGKVISYSYDKTGNLVAQDAAGEEKTTQEYNQIGQLTIAETKDGKTEYQYDDKGQLISVTHPGGEKLQYTYDEYGRKSSLTYPDGKKVGYEYDEMDRLVKVTGLEGETTTYTYNANGQRVKTDSDGLVTTYAYDNMGNLVNQATRGKTALDLAYTYTPGGRMASEKRTENGQTVTSEYTYDLLGQLTSFVKSDGYAESYSYDSVGNMKRKILTQGGESTALNMRYNKGNQMTSMSSALGKIGYKYDKNGNLIQKKLGVNIDTYTYDAQDRLASFAGYDGFEQRYRYDAMGLRSGMEQKGSTNRQTLEEMLKAAEPQAEKDAAAPDVDEWQKTSYIYDVTLPYGQMLTETTGGNTTSYSYGLERISAQSSALKTQYVYDGRGSVAQTVAADKVQSFAYTAFGEQLGAKTIGFGYNAEWLDAATGMQNLRARQYESQMMRFSQKDLLRGSMEQPISLNRYLYVINDPNGFIDPSGRSLAEAKDKAKEMVDAQRKWEEYKAKDKANTKKGKKVQESAETKAAKAKMNQLAKTVYETLLNEKNLSSELQSILDQAKKLISKKGNLTDEDYQIMRATCKMMLLAEEEDKKYDPKKPFALETKNDYGTHYGKVPVQFGRDVIYQMIYGPGVFVHNNSIIRFKPDGSVEFDCVGLPYMIAKAWMDEDVFQFQVKSQVIKRDEEYQHYGAPKELRDESFSLSELANYDDLSILSYDNFDNSETASARRDAKENGMSQKDASKIRVGLPDGRPDTHVSMLMKDFEVRDERGNVLEIIPYVVVESSGSGGEPIRWVAVDSPWILGKGVNKGVKMAAPFMALER